MTMDFDLERQIGLWRETLGRAAGLPAEDLQELEDHLRDEVDSLLSGGLAEDEAFLIALKRIGDAHEVARQLAVLDADKTWRQFFEPEAVSDQSEGNGQRPTRQPPPATRHELGWVVGAALLAAALGKVPAIFGITLWGADTEVYLRNLALFVVPILMAGYYARRRFSPRIAAFLAFTVLAAALAANLYPYAMWGSTSFLVALHLPLLLWLAFGLAYCGDEWRTVRVPLDFIRFTGEFFLYSVLIGCGGLVLVGLVVAFFGAIGINAEAFAAEYIAFSILLATPVIAAYLVEKKRSLIENLAPVLARIFIPLFLLMMVAFIVTVAVRQQSIMANREMLILIDILLLLVVGMVLYDLSARTDEGEQGQGQRRGRARLTIPHGLNLALILAALVIDCIALYGIGGRLAEYGFSPNKTAALGENILLLGNLVGLALAYIRVAAGRATHSQVLAWQVRYLPVYFAWMAFMVFVLPVIFGFA